MNKIKNEEYTTRINSLINDIFYTDELSNEGKLLIIRPYTEILIRKLLNIGPKKYFTLGNELCKKKLHELNSHIIIKKNGLTLRSFHVKAHGLLLNKSRPYINNIEKYSVPAPPPSILEQSIRVIQKNGNNYGHSSYLQPALDKDVNESIQAISNIISYIFVNFFYQNYNIIFSPEREHKKIQNTVLYNFSLLPPSIRYQTFEYLRIIFPKDLEIAIKLTLAKFKMSNLDDYKNWLESNKDYLTSITFRTSELNDDELENHLNNMGFANCKSEEIRDNIRKMYTINPQNMYIYAHEIINNPLETDTQYETLEEASYFYRKEFQNIYQNNEVFNLFRDLMDFVYIGRQYY